MSVSIKNYLLVTASYWSYTLSDGALRMLVLLYFYHQGYSAFEIAMLFLFYELFGVVTNLLGGWLGSHLGLKTLLVSGLGLQVFALLMLAQLDPSWPHLAAMLYVMASQGLSGIAKDLTKVSAKSALKYVIPGQQQGQLFKWVAVLTGSKNTLKGLGFFLGGLLLSIYEFKTTLYILAIPVFIMTMLSVARLPAILGKSSSRKKFSQLFSRSQKINTLSAARLFLFASRDVWFAVGLPVYLTSVLAWQHSETGAFMAAWIIGYGIVQSFTPGLLRKGVHPDGKLATRFALLLAAVTLLIIVMLSAGFAAEPTITIGLGIFAIAFAINSSLHSFLIIDYSEHDHASVDVGFYYMANAAGRLLGTLLSGWAYLQNGLQSCLWVSLLFIILAALLSTRLSRIE